MGLKHTSNEERLKFRVTSERYRVKKVIKEHSTCTKCESKLASIPAVPQLIDFRVRSSEGFESVVTDLSGLQVFVNLHSRRERSSYGLKSNSYMFVKYGNSYRESAEYECRSIHNDTLKKH